MTGGLLNSLLTQAKSLLTPAGTTPRPAAEVNQEEEEERATPMSETALTSSRLKSWLVTKLVEYVFKPMKSTDDLSCSCSSVDQGGRRDVLNPCARLLSLTRCSTT